MRNFTYGQRVIVTDPNVHEGIIGKAGTVRRIRMADDGAWIAMDEELPEELQSFPTGDTRHNYIMLYPEQCAPEKSK